MRLRKGIVLQKMGTSYVAYDNNTSTIHELNEVAYQILSLIEKGESKNDVVNKLTRKYSVIRKKAQEDVETFLKVLLKKDLIEIKK